MGDQIRRLVLNDGTDNLGSKSQTIFDVLSYEGACGKSRRVHQVKQNVVSVADNLCNDSDPDKYFDKTKQWCQIPFSA
jgi:hypothetical protein